MKRMLVKAVNAKASAATTTETLPKILQTSLLVTFFTTLTACTWMTPPQKRISKARDLVSQGFQKEVYSQKYGTNQGLLNISWQEGLSRMYLSNPELIQADYRIEDAKQRQKQIWKDMIPGLNLGVNDSFQLGELGDAFSNPVYRIDSFLNLGNLLELPKNIYTRKITYIGSELQAENTMRQQVIALYRLFQQQRLLNLEKKAIDLEGELVRGITGVEGAEIIEMKVAHKEALESWEQNYRDWNTKVGDFFMAGYDKIDLKESGLPDISYKPSDLDFTNTKRWGMLQLNLLALEQIAEDGRVLEAYLRYLPRANLSVSAPALYSNSSSESFDIKNIRLGPSLFWSLDSRGYISQQIKRLKRENPIKEWRKDKRQRDEVRKLFEGKKALQDVQKELTTLRQAMEGYRQAVRQGLIKDPEKAIRTMRRLREREVRLVAREIEICTSFWLIDESRWKPITKRWLATREARANIRDQAIKKKKKGFLDLR